MMAFAVVPVDKMISALEHYKCDSAVVTISHLGGNGGPIKGRIGGMNGEQQLE